MAGSSSSGNNRKYSAVAIAGIVALYMFVSITLVFTNKLLVSSGASMPAPLFVTWFQCAVSVVICWAAGLASTYSAPGSFWKQFTPYEYKLHVGKSTLALSLVFVGMMSFNNLCLKYVEVSFYNVARSLTIVFNVVLTYLVLGDKTSFKTMTTLIVVIFGFCIGSKGEVHFSFTGTLFGVISSVFVSMYAIVTKRTLDAVDGNKFRLSAYLNTNATLLFPPIIIMTGELDIVLEYYHLLLSPQFWLLMVVSGVFGFSIGIVSMLQIQATSPLTHNISGTAKACLQTVLALLYYRNPTTAANLVGIAAVLFGSLLYTYVRMSEMEAAKAASAPADSLKGVQLSERAAQRDVAVTVGSTSPANALTHRAGSAGPSSETAPLVGGRSSTGSAV